MLDKPRILTLFFNRLINLKKNEHECKILYMFSYKLLKTSSDALIITLTNGKSLDFIRVFTVC